MSKPIKKEDFLRYKDPIHAPGTKLHGCHLVHGEDTSFNNDITDWYTSINCGVILDHSYEKGLQLISSQENNDGYLVGTFEMTCPPNLKLGEIIDRVPYGILDKTITGIGATTLECITTVRSSIIVVPTKALAYNKHVAINQKDNGLTMYVGSAYGEVKRDFTLNDVRNYINKRNGAVRKFITVADSLPKLLDYLSKLKEPVFNDYFLMVDEIDTMQMDSSYRPRLETVIDNYFKFDFMNRSLVSASIQPFSNPLLEKEARLLLKLERPLKRNIGIVATNAVDEAAVQVMVPLIEGTKDKILIAYNSLDGIFNIAHLLGLKEGSYGILCSNRSLDKVRDFDQEAADAITKDGFLKKRITFMTCAYFAGIDIMDSCHLISISSFKQPFSQLSLAKLTQIAGRCRPGNLSETIIYDIANTFTLDWFDNVNDYRRSLIEKAQKYSDFLNSIYALATKDIELKPMLEFVKSYVSFASQHKYTHRDYPYSIVRENSVTKKYVPSYFNIDALIDRWVTINELYTDDKSLYKALTNQGHDVVEKAPLYIPQEERIKEFLKEIKVKAQEKLERDFESLRQALLEWDRDNRNEYALEELNRNASKRLQDTVISPFKKLYPFIPIESLLEGLKDCYLHERKLRNYVNAGVFYALPLEHPFKATVLASYGVDPITGQGTKRMNLEERNRTIKDVFHTVLKSDRIYSESVWSDMLKSFFHWASSGRGDRVDGLNPKEFPPLKSKLDMHTEVLSLLVFPK